MTLPSTSAQTFNSALPQAIAAIRRSTRITVLSHYSPDPDAYGSSCGLALALASAGKTVEIVNEDGSLPKLSFIPGVRDVIKVPVQQPDLVIVCDCGDKNRVGESLEKFVSAATEVINLDHHTSNEGFGTIQLVDETASSASELVFRLLQAAGFSVAADPATALLCGIIADTGSFRYSSTTAETLEAAAQLVRLGASPRLLSEQLFSQQSLTTIRLHAETLSSLRLLAEGQICILTVSPDLVSRLGASSDDSEGLVEKGRDIQGVRVSVLMRWVDGLWRVSLRSRDARWNVSQLAHEFGGGGHKVAAAFRWKRPLAELEAQLFPKLTELVLG